MAKKRKTVPTRLVPGRVFEAIQKNIRLIQNVFEAVDNGAVRLLPLVRMFFEEQARLVETANVVRKPHIPPSQCPFEGKKLRKKGSGPVGGVKGHKGTTHELDPNPDKSEEVPFNAKKYEDDEEWTELEPERRQVHTQIIKKYVHEYRRRRFQNVVTGEIFYCGEFPEGFNAPVQFGKEVQHDAVLMMDQHNIPYKQISEIFAGRGLNISPATIVNMVKKAHRSQVLQNFFCAVVISLKNARCLNLDESSMKNHGKPGWVHIKSSPLWTLFHYHSKRGKEGTDAVGVMDGFTGVIVHDCWSPYFNYEDCLHALCNAHLLRDLATLIELGLDLKWAGLMKKFLLDLNVRVNKSGGKLSPSAQSRAKRRFDQIIAIGLEETGGEMLPRPPTRKGRKKKAGKTAMERHRVLLERFINRKDSVLRFTTEEAVPFTNNDAERPIRQLKKRAKIAGSFRSLEMAEGYCLMRSFIETCRKHGISPSQAVKMVIDDETPDFIFEVLSELDCEGAHQEAA
jgi:transposase